MRMSFNLAVTALLIASLPLAAEEINWKPFEAMVQGSQPREEVDFSAFQAMVEQPGGLRVTAYKPDMSIFRKFEAMVNGEADDDCGCSVTGECKCGPDCKCANCKKHKQDIAKPSINPPPPKAEKAKPQVSGYRSGGAKKTWFMTDGRGHRIPDSLEGLRNHLKFESEHRGKYDEAWIDSLTIEQLQKLHSDEHEHTVNKQYAQPKLPNNQHASARPKRTVMVMQWQCDGKRCRLVPKQVEVN